MKKKYQGHGNAVISIPIHLKHYKIHACMHILMHTHMHTCRHTHAHTHTHRGVFVHTQTHTHTKRIFCTHAHTHTHTHCCRKEVNTLTKVIECVKENSLHAVHGPVSRLVDFEQIMCGQMQGRLLKNMFLWRFWHSGFKMGLQLFSTLLDPMMTSLTRFHICCCCFEIRGNSTRSKWIAENVGDCQKKSYFFSF